jgi:hypothetical protein
MNVVRFEKLEGGGLRKVVTEDGECYIEWMARKGCVLEEIAEEMGVTRPTLFTLHNKDRVKTAYDKGYAECNNRIRRAQVSHAIEGNAQLLIWLGKVRLGQKDESSVEVVVRDKTTVTFEELQDIFGPLDDEGNPVQGAERRGP